MALSSTAIVKIIVVTDDLERTAGAYERLLGTDRKMEESGEHRTETLYPVPGETDYRYPDEGKKRTDGEFLV